MDLHLGPVMLLGPTMVTIFGIPMYSCCAFLRRHHG